LIEISHLQQLDDDDDALHLDHAISAGLVA